MMESDGPSRLGVCSWSLRPESPADLAEKIAATGLSAVQLALRPLISSDSSTADTPAWSVEATVEALAARGIALVSGMLELAGEDYSSLASIRRTGGVRPDATWDANRAAAQACAQLARRMELPLVTFHAGFLPEDPADAERATMLDRVAVLADLFAEQGVAVGLETGQESAETLLSVLEQLDHPNVGVNFDPANMLLYGTGDPIDALAALGRHVLQVHVKDARPSPVPDAWGEEVVVGTGGVDWSRFFATLAAANRRCDAMIEREAGDDRVGDIVAARRHVAPLLEALT